VNRARSSGKAAAWVFWSNKPRQAFRYAKRGEQSLRDLNRCAFFGELPLGASIPVVGIATTISMGRLRLHDGRPDTPQFLIIPFFDMVAFTVAFGLASYWRKKPEVHRRLSLVATCLLTAAAFGRFPTTLIPHYWFYAGVDVLIFLGAVRDLIVTKRIHPVYVFALPLLALGQTPPFTFL
jgi:hypothetical protein